MHNDDVFVGNSFTVFFKERQKNIVNQKEAIVGLPDDGGNFVGMEAKIQGVQNAARARNAKKGFQVSGVIPHHGGDAVTRPQAEISQRRSEEARATAEVAVDRARDGLVEFPVRDNFSWKRGKFRRGCSRPLRPRSRACGSPVHWTARKESCFFSALRDSHLGSGQKE